MWEEGDLVRRMDWTEEMSDVMSWGTFQDEHT